MEELFPFFFFWIRAERILKRAADLSTGEAQGDRQYYKLKGEVISMRLKEEHERAKSIDEKTVKFTVSLSIVLTILGLINGYFSKTLQNDILNLFISSVSGVSVLYTITGGVLALGALKTLPTYGYGTRFILEARAAMKAKVAALIAQENVNIVRQLRNEAAFQCLRNGFLALLISAILFIVAPFIPFKDEPAFPPNEPKTELPQKEESLEADTSSSSTSFHPTSSVGGR